MYTVWYNPGYDNKFGLCGILINGLIPTTSHWISSSLLTQSKSIHDKSLWGQPTIENFLWDNIYLQYNIST